MALEYRNFLDNFLHADSLARRDGTPFYLLDRLNDEEKSKAEEELLKRLKGNDIWIIDGLGHLKSKKALPKLYELLNKKWDRSLKAFIATAIWKICKDEKMLEVVLRQSEYNSFWARLPFFEYKMIDVVLCLAQFPQPEALLRLQELTTDFHYLISYNAKRAIDLRKSFYKIDT